MEAPFVRVLCGPEGSVPGDPCHQGWLLYVVAVFRLTVWILPLASDRGAAPVALRLSCLLLWEAFIFTWRSDVELCRPGLRRARAASPAVCSLGQSCVQRHLSVFPLCQGAA